MFCKFSLNLFLSSSSFKDDSKGDDDNANNKLMKFSDEEMKKAENFNKFN